MRADMSKVDPEDAGYNLRPEHIESTYLLHCITQVCGVVWGRGRGAARRHAPWASSVPW